MFSSKELLQVTQNLSRLRENKNITQQQIAQAIGVSVGTISRWENSAFKSTKIFDLIAYIEYMENQGVNLTIVPFKSFQRR